MKARILIFILLFVSMSAFAGTQSLVETLVTSGEQSSDPLVDVAANELFKLYPDKELKLVSAPQKETVTGIWQDSATQSYFVFCRTNKGFTHAYTDFFLVITPEGRIEEFVMATYGDSRNVKSYWLDSFVDQDATLSDVTLVAGVTYSSSAIRGAVKDAFLSLTEEGFLDTK